MADFWLKILLPKKKQCFLENYEISEGKPRILSLSDFSGSFTILLLGSSLSLIVFLVECMVRMVRHISAFIGLFVLISYGMVFILF